jgi:indole-3-glycerol phosphate synthase
MLEPRIRAGEFLARMARASRLRAITLRCELSLPALRARALASPAPRPLRLSSAGFDLIAEIKFHSPAQGRLARPSRRAAAERARCYAQAGAAAISVLTEPTRFAGSLEHLRSAAAAVQVPCMRKDFLVDPVQIFEARIHGASGVLLILRLLDDAGLDACLEACREARLFALLEAFDERDLARLARLRLPREVEVLAGINARDLQTLQVVPERTIRLAPRLRTDLPGVAESGVDSAEAAARAARAGFALALVGSAFMGTNSPARSLRAFLDAGRTARKETPCSSS